MPRAAAKLYGVVRVPEAHRCAYSLLHGPAQALDVYSTPIWSSWTQLTHGHLLTVQKFPETRISYQTHLYNDIEIVFLRGGPFAHATPQMLY